MFYVLFFVFFFFKQKTAYEIMPSLVGSEMCIRDRSITARSAPCTASWPQARKSASGASSCGPIYKKPELLAQAPNEVWSWDITKLMGPAKWSYFYLYVIIDIFSRRVVGWCVADRESATLFTALFNDTAAKNPAPPGQLTLHADRGGPMRAKATALLLADLGVTKSHSRPHTSNDNPFSESHFKTMKYQPQFPQRFGCIQDAKNFCRSFFALYQQDHHHAGIGLLTPDQVHYGQADEVHAARQITRRRLQQKPRTLRQKGARTARKANRDLDQSADQSANGPSLNAKLDCLKI